MPEPQNLSNHVRYDPWFHFLLVPWVAVLLGYAARAAWKQPDETTLFLLALSAGLVVFLLRMRIYALRVQDRVIRLEERLRLAMLLPEPQQARIAELGTRQLVALRFASDHELPELVAQTLEKNLEPDDIKKSIRAWRADHLRV